MRTRLTLTPSRPDGGFTALEIAMVASIIAILALLILPIFRKRTDEAKLTAARDELQSLAKALILAEADTDRSWRLQDLGFTDIPIAAVFRELTAQEIAQLTPPTNVLTTGAVGATYWRGPYIAFQKAATVQDVRSQRAYIFSDNNGSIFYVDSRDDEVRIPLDPWGSPYLFLDYRDANWRAEIFSDFGVETSFNQRVLYSMGPDGIPGSLDVNGGGFNPANAFFYCIPDRTRQNGVLGRTDSDDLEYVF